MQSNLSLIITLIIIVLLGGFGTIFLTVRNLSKRFDNLKEHLAEIKDMPVAETIDAVKKMHLIGVSQTSLEEWNTKYQQLSDEVVEIEKDFDELAETINKYTYIKHSKQFLDYIEDRLEDIDVNMKDVYEGVHKLRASEKQNSERIQASVELLDQYAKEINDDDAKTTFGVALSEVKKNLILVQQIFDEFEKLNKNGDPIEAAKLIQKAEHELDSLKELMQGVPPLNNELEILFADQLKD